MQPETKSTRVDEPEIADLRCITAYRAGLPREIVAMFTENLAQAYAEELNRKAEFREEFGQPAPMPLWKPWKSGGVR